jgi:serine/threonine-protein kinase
MSEADISFGNGRYVVQSKLGEGGHAAVYRVLDTRLGVARAMKLLHPDAARRNRLRARFDQEARTMAQLDHPNVVRVYDVATEGPLPYLVMELVTGGSLGG